MDGLKMTYLMSRKFRVLMLIFSLVSLATFLLKEPSFLIIQFQNMFNRPCGCNSCIWDPMEADAWFSERFNHSILPLLSRSNSELSGDTYNWWLVSTLHCFYRFIVLSAVFGQPRHISCLKFEVFSFALRYEISIRYMADLTNALVSE